MEEKKRQHSPIKVGCSIVFVTIHLIILLLILTMCHVPKRDYEPYLTAGEQYYQEILGVSPTIASSKYYADEGGGFSITVTFSPEQMKNPLVKQFTKNQSELSFRGTSTESNIVGISEEATKNLEAANSFHEFNRPVSKMLDDLLKNDNPDSELSKSLEEKKIYMCSTDLSFWKKVFNNYERLKDKPFEERFYWLKEQTGDKTFFFLSTEIAGSEFLFETLKKDAFPVDVFPVGTIFKMKGILDNKHILYQSDENYQLVESKNDYPVTY